MGSGTIFTRNFWLDSVIATTCSLNYFAILITITSPR